MTPAAYCGEAGTTTRFVDGGQKHQRAPRIPESEWRKHKPTLKRLYENHTLSDVMTIMAHKYSKRQLNYKFELWRCNKYGKRRRNSDAASSPADSHIPDPFAGDSQISSSSSPNPSVAVKEQSLFVNTEYENEDSASDCECSSEFHIEDDGGGEYGDYDDSFNFSDDVEHQQRIPPNLLSSTDYKSKLAADFCAALSDDTTAFKLYSDLYRALLSRPDASPETRHSLLVSCVRSASHPSSAKLARSLMAQHQTQLQPSPDDEPLTLSPFLSSMLDASMQERDPVVDQASITRRIADIMSGVLGGGSALVPLPHNYTAIDLVTYQFLSHGLDKYAECLGPAAATPALASTLPPHHKLLDQYVTKQPFYERLQRAQRGLRHSSSQSALRSCVRWCRHQLHRADLVIPLAVRSIRGETKHLRWTDDIQLFCTLWDAMLEQLRHGGVFPAWYAGSDVELGISPSELLVTVCWLIGVAATAGKAADPILKRARESVDSIATCPDKLLWTMFLNQFTWMNKIVDLDPADRDFDGSAADCVRAYIASSLGMQLPPADTQLEEAGLDLAMGTSPLPVAHDIVNFADMDFMSKLDPTTFGGDPMIFGGDDGLGMFSSFDFISPPDMHALTNQLNNELELA